MATSSRCDHGPHPRLEVRHEPSGVVSEPRRCARRGRLYRGKRMQRSWQTENKLAATQYPPVTRSSRVAAEIKPRGRLPCPDPKSTLAGHLCTSNRFGEKEPFPPCNAGDFSYSHTGAPSCTCQLGLPDEPTFANRFSHQIAVKGPTQRLTPHLCQQTSSKPRRLPRRLSRRASPCLPKPAIDFAVNDLGVAQISPVDAGR